MATVKVHSTPELDGREIEGHEIVVVRSEVSGEWVIAQKDQPYHENARRYYLSYRNGWDFWAHSQTFGSLELAVKYADALATPTLSVIPYDEIDQSDDAVEEQLPLFP